MYSIKVKCPHCIHHVNISLKHVTEYASRKPVALNVLQPQQIVSARVMSSTTRVSAYSTALCPECNGPLMISFECQFGELTDIRHAAGKSEWVLTGPDLKSIKVYPELNEPDDSPHFPQELRAIFVELQEDIQLQRTATRIVVGCRSVLEVALRALGYKDGNLLSRINNARTDGLLTESMKNWSHRIRINGNEAVHELQATDEEAREFVAFLKLFLEIAFVLPERIREQQEDTAHH